MTRCWYEDSEERPSFDELATELEKVLSIMVGYMELNMELVAITEDEHSKQVHSEYIGDTVLIERISVIVVFLSKFNRSTFYICIKVS